MNGKNLSSEPILMFTITPAVFAGLPAHKPRILIVSLRDLGDALLAAALGPAVRFLRPDAETWLLTFRRNASIIEGVPGIDGVITVEDKPNLPDLLSDLRCLWNRFEWSVCTLTSDRAFYYGFAAGRKQVMHETQDRLRRNLISDLIPLDDSAHQLDRIAALLAPIARETGKSSVPEVHPYAPYSALSAEDSQWCRESPFVVLHMSGKYSDKDVAREVWRAVAKCVVAEGFRIAFTGGGSEKEEVQIKDATSEQPPESWRNFSGKLTFGRTGALLRKASLYVGVDTSATHVAAAVGLKTIAIFGSGSIPDGAPRLVEGIGTTATSRCSSVRTA